MGNWIPYAAAAGAALAMSTNASASIIYSGPQNIPVTIPTGDVNTQKIAQFSVAQVDEAVYLQNFTDIVSARAGSAALDFVTSTKRLAFARSGALAKLYNLGQAILMTGPVSARAVLRENNIDEDGGAFGLGTVSGFIGFKSTHTGDLGWIDVKVFDRNSDGYPDELEILGSAYNSVSGGAIDAGETPSTPEPGTAALSLLALGASGILALRKRRQQVPVRVA